MTDDKKHFLHHSCNSISIFDPRHAVIFSLVYKGTGTLDRTYRTWIRRGLVAVPWVCYGGGFGVSSLFGENVREITRSSFSRRSLNHQK